MRVARTTRQTRIQHTVLLPSPDDVASSGSGGIPAPPAPPAGAVPTYYIYGF